MLSGDPKAVKIGQRWNGVTVVAVEKERATVEIDGKRRVLALGQHYRGATAASPEAAARPNADVLNPPRPADAGSGAAPVVCSGVSNVGPATEFDHVRLVRRGVNANQCMADENLTRLNRRDHAVVDAPLGSQRQAIQ